MIAAICEVSTACVEMLAEVVEREDPPPVVRLHLATALLAGATILVAIWEQR